MVKIILGIGIIMGDRIDAISRIRSLEPANEEAAWVVKPSSGLSLPDLFQGESFGATIGNVEQTTKFWNKAASPSIETDEAQAVDASLVVSDAQAASKAKPLSPIPVLDEPEVDFRLNPTLPSQQKNANSTLTLEQLGEATALMSDETISNIMQIILRAQFELENETAVTQESTFAHYRKLKDAQIKILQEVKDALVKDERVASYLGTAQNIAMAATFVCQVATATGWLNTLGPVATTVILAVTAGATALVSGTKAFFNRRTDENKAQFSTISHHNQFLSQLNEESREHLVATAENDNAFKEKLIYLIRRLRKMNSIMLKK